MIMKIIYYLLCCLFSVQIYAQYNFNYNFNTTGRRVCLVSATVNESPAIVTINLLDAPYNTSEPYTIKKRPINGTNVDWTVVVSNLIGTTSNFTDTNVTLGQAYEYQIKRTTASGVAIGYLTAGIGFDQSNFKGRMLLVIDNSFQISLSSEILQLKKDLTNEGWLVIELYVPRATTWETETSILTVKQAIVNAYTNVPVNEKPTHLFLLGHIPIARSGQNAIAPDNHDINKGARGADCYYADIDGVFTDIATYNPGNINSKAINLPGDLKWDQDFIPSQLEMAFGRIDFADITSYAISEENLLRNYLNRLHNYRIVANESDMGEKTAFRSGYDNSNDGSYRSMIPISGESMVDYYSGNLPFPQWVQQNGPYQIFMQNSLVPNINDWNTSGMNATVFSSDQSYWGYWDEPESFNYAKIRALLGADTKCIAAIYTTTAVNIFHQPAMGETMGWSCKRIMDHNSTNNLLEKPEQAYDTSQFWNRTHFQFTGDPTIRLFQVKPAGNLQASLQGSNLELTWNASAENNIIGYHVYKSTSEFGTYTRLTSTPISALNYTDVAFSNTNHWYMIRAIKSQITGSGSYLNPSIGISKSATEMLSIENFKKNSFSLYPNPANSIVTLESNLEIKSISIYDLQGKLIFQKNNSISHFNISNFENGIYLVKITSQNGDTNTIKLIKK